MSRTTSSSSAISSRSWASAFSTSGRGTNLADQATAGYRAAWEKKGMLDAHGHVISTWMVRQDHKVDAFSGGFDAWAGSAMNAWNRDVVRARYPGQVVEWIERRPDGLMTLRSPREVMATRAARDAGRAAPPDRTFLANPGPRLPATRISEMGDAETLRGLLGYADRYMNPTWDRGALYYPRHDRPYDDAGNMTFMDPVTGNAMLAYARLNVGEGVGAFTTARSDRNTFGNPRWRTFLAT
ncbi:MAG: hypothetical protein IPN16_20715 [Gemmatimonadetes bacterium]|nr:hypothetical protein [Gemmatimonadota bacterium]